MGSTISTIRVCLLAIFNIGIITRILIILFNGMDEDSEENPKKSIKNHIRAAIIVNLIAGLVIVIKRYYD